MGQIVFVLLVIGGLGYFFYRQMSAGDVQSDSSWAPEKTSGTSTGVEANASVQSDTDDAEPEALDTRIVALVSRTPGILQTDIYAKFPDESRKSLQAVLLQMDKDGALRREREGPSYRLFVV